MRLFLFASIITFSVNVLAEAPTNDTLVRLSAEQSKSYGIVIENLQQAGEVLGARYQAEVVVPNSQLQVISVLQGGLVEGLMVAEGERVQKGQVLAKINSPGVLELQRDLLQTMSQLNLARSSLSRNKQLLDEGIIPKRRYLESLSVWQELITQKEQQETTLAFSGMSSEAISKLEKTRKLGSVLVVVAPFDGVLLEQMAIPGQKLGAADPLFKIGKLSPLWLEIHVPISVVTKVKVGGMVAIPNLNVQGKVITIGRMVHAADQGILVRALVENNVEQLRPGQVVQVRIAIETSAQQNYYMVSRKSIVRLDKETIIFIEHEQGYEAVKVEVIGAREGEQIIAAKKSILAPVVTSGAVSLKAILMGAGGEG
ncbi:MAG: efflux RND transporter periplasmic adaptor subunit [Cycloclasticus sp.]|nr:efflux RND transporter periplasmic adaptor subunit [Cycloclasticus sp.]